jgi:hemerythrin superfamily protein
MATKSRSRNTSSNRTGRSGRSAFGWTGQGGALAAAMAGAAIGLAANFGRKFVVQGIAGTAGDWDEVLAAEHQMVLALFDKIEATGDDQAGLRLHLLGKIRNALGKHALEEENVVYPALRQANRAHDADALNSEHGYVKTFLYELETMPANGAAWLARAIEFRTLLEEHMRMEEEEVFPALKAGLTEEQNAKLGAAMSREGMKLA